MKKQIVITLAFFLLLFPSMVRAQESTPKPECGKASFLTRLLNGKYAHCGGNISRPLTSLLSVPAKVLQTTQTATVKLLTAPVGQAAGPVTILRQIALPQTGIATSSSKVWIAGKGIALVGNQITNTGILTLSPGAGIGVVRNQITNTDKGSDQALFKNIVVANQDTIAATANADSFTIEAGGGIALSTDAVNKKLTISSTVSGSSLTNSGTTVLQASSGQTADILDIRNSSGSNLAYFNSVGALRLPANGLQVGSTQLYVANGRVGINTVTPTMALDVNGSVNVATNQGITLTANNDTGSIVRLINLKATTKYDRPWISSIDYTGRHVVAFGALDTNWDSNLHKRFELKTVGAAGGPDAQTMLTRLAIDYDTQLANVIFGRNASVGIHNNYGEKAVFVMNEKDPTNTTTIPLGQWTSEIGSDGGTVMTFDPKVMTGTETATLRLFRETNTTNDQKRIVVYKGDGTTTETFTINAGTGATAIDANAQALALGDGTNTTAYVNVQATRMQMGYDGSNATIQSGNSKGIKFNVNASSFGQGTVMTITSAGRVGIGTTGPSSLLSVGSTSQFQVDTTGAIAAAAGIISSGTITFSGLNTAGGIVYTDANGTLGTSVVGAPGQCLVSNGAAAPTWGACGTGNSSSNWAIGTGAISPINATLDLLIGGTSTAAAKFAFLNVSSGTPTASIAGNIVLNSAGVIQTTLNQPLTIGGDSTGTISLMPLNGMGGRVGINTTAPTASLHVASNSGSLAVGDGTNATAYANFQANRTMVGYDGSFAVLQGGTSKGVKLNVGNASFGQGTALTIKSTGEVGIGTTSPSTPLHVKGGTTDVAKFENSAGGTACTLSATTGLLSCTSDQRLKKNIDSLDPAMDQVMRLRPVEYNWNFEGDTQTKHTGFIAQEVEQVFPTLVSTDASSGYKQLSMIGLVPYLTRAIQEQELKISNLDQQLSGGDLQKQLDNQGQKLLSLESRLTTLEQKPQLSIADFVNQSLDFTKLISFLSDVTFKGKAIFTKPPEFSQDTTGIAVIKPGVDQVRVNFDSPYAHVPQVNVTLRLPMDAAAQHAILSANLQYGVTDITETGFTLKLGQPAPVETSFSWVAVTTAQPHITVSGDASAAPISTPEPTPDLSPSPTSASSAIPTSSPLVTQPSPASDSTSSGLISD